MNNDKQVKSIDEILCHCQKMQSAFANLVLESMDKSTGRYDRFASHASEIYGQIVDFIETEEE